MKDLLFAFGIGAVAGSRTMLAPALAAGASASPLGGMLGRVTASSTGPVALGLLALAELVADKAPWTPARTEALPLGGRLVSGALTASACARPGRAGAAAVAGAAGALAGSYAFFHLRRFARTRLGASNVACGLAEDAVALASGLLLTRCRP